MHRFLTICAIAVLVFGSQLAVAQNVDPALLEALKKNAEALKQINKESIRRNPDSVMKALSKYLHLTDSARGAIINNALEHAPDKDIVKRYLNTKTAGDTAYTTVQFYGTMGENVSTESENSHKLSMLNASSSAAPLVQKGSLFTVMLYSQQLMPAKYSAAANSYGSLSKYITHQGDIVGTGSYTNHVISTDYQSAQALHTTISEKSAGNSGKTQWIFSFDTLTNLGQVSCIQFATIQHRRVYDTVVGGVVKAKTEEYAFEMPVGVAAETNPQSWRFNEYTRDSAMRKVDSLTHRRMSTALPSDNGDDKPVLIITKTPYGFALTCDYDHAEEGRDTHVHLTGFIGRPPLKYEAVIYPAVPAGGKGNAAYEEWLPKGPKLDGSDDTKGDDKMSFYVVVRNKTDNTKIYHNYTVKWSLLDVTNYPGICNNYPKYTDNPNVEPDLKFHTDTKSDTHFDGNVTDNTAISKDGGGEFATVKINCLDYAAWGKLAAHIILDDGTELEAHPYYETDVPFITLPYDRDENHLADYWEKKVGQFASGHPLIWDEDEKMDQKETGDGYTLFEEYRGFFVQDNVLYKPDNVQFNDHFVRTDPAYKDVFVYDMDDLFKTYYAQDNPAHLNWHYVVPAKDQLVYIDLNNFDPTNRWVNFNTVQEYTYAKQYGMVLLKDIVCYDETAAGLTWSKGEYDYSISARTSADHKIWEDAAVKEGKQGPLQGGFKCVVYIPVITELFMSAKTQHGQAKAEALVQNQIKITVIHEVGHNIGVPHHSAPKGVENTEKEDVSSLAKSDGVLDCPMRYPNKNEEHDIVVMLYPCVNYCRKGQTAVYFVDKFIFDADGNKIKDRVKEVTGGSKDSDDCWGQITVKTKPAP